VERRGTGTDRRVEGADRRVADGKAPGAEMRVGERRLRDRRSFSRAATIATWLGGVTLSVAILMGILMVLVGLFD
jgi:hypothetical protein